MITCLETLDTELTGGAIFPLIGTDQAFTTGAGRYGNETAPIEFCPGV